MSTYRIIPAGPLPPDLIAPGSKAPSFGVDVVMDENRVVQSAVPTKKGEALIIADGAGLYCPHNFTLKPRREDRGTMLLADNWARLEPMITFDLSDVPWGAELAQYCFGHDVWIDGEGFHRSRR